MMDILDGIKNEIARIDLLNDMAEGMTAPKSTAILNAAQREIERLRTLARDAYAAWDSDKDARVGKLLIAMLYENFSEKYRPDLTHNVTKLTGAPHHERNESNDN